MTYATWTDIVTGITLLLGIAVCASSGFRLQQRVGSLRRWPLADATVFALTNLWIGLFILHIAMSRIYHDDIVYHLFDLNSPWTAGIRGTALFMVIWSIFRVVDPIDKESRKG